MEPTTESGADLVKDLRELLEVREVQLCSICTLLKTLPGEESAVLATALEQVPATKLRAVLTKNGITVSEKRIYRHRNECGE